MTSTQIMRAIQLHEEASTAEMQGNLNRAEVLYLESKQLFLLEGGMHLIDAANIMIIIARMKEKHGDFYGAILATEGAKQIMAAHVGMR
jgi:hypothetical protein